MSLEYNQHDDDVYIERTYDAEIEKRLDKRVIEHARIYRRFTARIGRIIIDRVAECGSYWKAVESLEIPSSTAARWRDKGIAGEDIYCKFWKRVRQAQGYHDLQLYPLTKTEELLFAGDQEAMRQFKERVKLYEAAAMVRDPSAGEGS